VENLPSRDQGGETDSNRELAEETRPEDVQAWEQIEAGRYMPRRIRGSCRGRTLG